MAEERARREAARAGADARTEDVDVDVDEPQMPVADEEFFVEPDDEDVVMNEGLEPLPEERHDQLQEAMGRHAEDVDEPDVTHDARLSKRPSE